MHHTLGFMASVPSVLPPEELVERRLTEYANWLLSSSELEKDSQGIVGGITDRPWT